PRPDGRHAWDTGFTCKRPTHPSAGRRARSTLCAGWLRNCLGNPGVIESSSRTPRSINVSLKERATLMHKESGHKALDEMRSQWRLMTVYERFEQVVAITLSGIIAVVIVISLIQLIRLVFTLLVMDALKPLDHQVFQLVFGATMTLLIAMEFKHSIVKVALRKESIIQVKTVILIAILALARKLIILEPDIAPAKVAVLAGTVLALGLTYWLMRERDDRKSEYSDQGPFGLAGRHDAVRSCCRTGGDWLSCGRRDAQTHTERGGEEGMYGRAGSGPSVQKSPIFPKLK